MKIEPTEVLPLARREAIITKEVDGELLVYDVTRDKAHCLNETAAAVWRLCDGRTSVAAIAARLTEDGQPATGAEQSRKSQEQSAKGEAQSFSGRRSPVAGRSRDHQIIWLALDQLRRSHLLEQLPDENDKTSWSAALPGFANMSRREAVRRIGLGAAITLPIVISMTAPTAVEAAVSCGAKCHPCSTPTDCCGVCTATVPGCPGAGNKCT
jgi:hypothetical protein